MIQTEGFKATKVVEPKLVQKKKDNKDIEVQEGWVGRIIPFDLIQKTLLQEESEKLHNNEQRLMEITTEQQDIIDSLSEEEKEDISDILNEDNTAFQAVALNKAVKELLKTNNVKNYSEDSVERKMITVVELIEEEKSLKKTLKTESDKLHLATKKTIENLSNEQVYSLLNLKWINPLITELNHLPRSVLDNLVAKVQSLVDKYAITFSDVENDILETEKQLSSMIDQLTGSDTDLQGLLALKELLRID